MIRKGIELVKSKILWISVLLSLSHLNYGFAVAYASNSQIALVQSNLLTNSQQFIYSSILNIGALFGSLVAGFFMMDFIGRKATLLTSSVFYAFGYILMVVINYPEVENKINVPILLIMSRVFVGIGLGIASACVQVYLSEILSIRLRKYFSLLPTVFLVVGLVFYFVASYFTLYNDFNNAQLVNFGANKDLNASIDNNNDDLDFFIDDIYEDSDETIDAEYDTLITEKNSIFRQSLLYMPIIGIIFALIEFLASLIVPESPVFIFKKLKTDIHQQKFIKEHLKRFYSDENSFMEYYNENFPEVEFKGDIKSKRVSRKSFNIFNRASIYPLSIGVSLMVLQQFIGVYAILYNSTSIFLDAGMVDPSENPAKAGIGSIAIGVTSFVGIFLGIPVSSYVGRRPSIIFGSIGMSVPLFLLGAYYRYNFTPTWLPVLFIVLFFIAYNLSWAFIPWVVMAEISNGPTKGIVVAIVSLSNWLFTFVVTLIYPNIIKNLGNDGTFFLFGSMALLSCLITYFVMPETKDLSSEQIAKYFTGEKRIFSFKCFSCEKNTQEIPISQNDTIKSSERSLLLQSNILI